MPDRDEPELLRLGDPGQPAATSWDAVRSTCTACGAVGVLDDGELVLGGRPVTWLGLPMSETFHWGLSGLPSTTLGVMAGRCRECGHLELFAPGDG